MALMDIDRIARISRGVNFETMRSQAWECCFGKFQDLRSEDYQNLIVVLLVRSARQDQNCTISVIQRIFVKKEMLDQKTVAGRVQRLIDLKLFRKVRHPVDRRKWLIEPTEELLDLFEEYGRLARGIAGQLATQFPTEVVLGSQIQYNLMAQISSSDALQNSQSVGGSK